MTGLCVHPMWNLCFWRSDCDGCVWNCAPVQSSHLLLLCFASTGRTEFRESYVPDECFGLREEGGNCGAEKGFGDAACVGGDGDDLLLGRGPLSLSSRVSFVWRYPPQPCHRTYPSSPHASPLPRPFPNHLQSLSLVGDPRLFGPGSRHDNEGSPLPVRIIATRRRLVVRPGSATVSWSGSGPESHIVITTLPIRGRFFFPSGLLPWSLEPTVSNASSASVDPVQCKMLHNPLSLPRASSWFLG
jgi:hypothetical protein